MNTPPSDDNHSSSSGHLSGLSGQSSPELESAPSFCTFEPGSSELTPSELLQLIEPALPLMESGRDRFSLYIGEVRCDLNHYLTKLVYGSLHNRHDFQELVNPYQLPYQSKSFHTIVLIDVLCQLRHLGTALDEFARVLHPDGILICIEPYTTVRLTGDSIERLWDHPKKEKAFHETSSYDASIPSTIFFSRDWIRKLNGWRVVRTHRYSARALRSSFQKAFTLSPLQQSICRITDRICNLISFLGVGHFFSDRCTVVLTRVGS